MTIVFLITLIIKADWQPIKTVIIFVFLKTEMSVALISIYEHNYVTDLDKISAVLIYFNIGIFKYYSIKTAHIDLSTILTNTCVWRMC